MTIIPTFEDVLIDPMKYSIKFPHTVAALLEQKKHETIAKNAYELHYMQLLKKKDLIGKL